MAMDNDRQPRWKKWRLMPEVRIFEAVALSLDIEPAKVQTTDYAWMGAKYPFDEGAEFNDRLDALLANSTNRTLFPTPCILNLSDGYQCGIRLSEFAQWAVSVAEWDDLPPELVAMAKAPDQQSAALAQQNVGAGDTAEDDAALPWAGKATSALPATAKEIAAAFPVKWADKWPERLKNAASGKSYLWLTGTVVHRGSRKPGDANTYSPAVVAAALVLHGDMTRAACDAAIKRCFPAWLDEWNSKAEYLKD